MFCHPDLWASSRRIGSAVQLFSSLPTRHLFLEGSGVNETPSRPPAPCTRSPASRSCTATRHDRQLYLDLNGHFEAQWGSYSNITTPVFDQDGDPTTFSDAELESIYDIWSRVTEDFAPFNVNVTTVEPPELAPGVPETAANGVAMRISIGGNGSWYGAVVRGVAYINSFTNSIPNVAYVFSDNSQWPGDTASHEAGHSFGLHHQSVYDQNGVKTEENSTGSGDWRPIMGTSSKDVTTWHNGTSTYGPTEYQDDMAIIAGSVNGFGYRADDHANSLSAATPLATDGSIWSGSGILGAERRCGCVLLHGRGRGHLSHGDQCRRDWPQPRCSPGASNAAGRTSGGSRPIRYAIRRNCPQPRCPAAISCPC